MEQKSSQSFFSENKKIHLVCESTTALGDLHDFLMAVKGDIVDRMVKAQKEEEITADEQTKKPEESPAEEAKK